MVRDAYIKLRGLRFHYRDWGGRGRPLLLLHGLASTSHIWDLTAPVLARRFRTLALDQRGHGESDKPEDGYDFPSFVADVDAFVGAFDLGECVVVGHSWGANVALQYAAERPNRASGLVLMDGGFSALSASMTWEETAKRLAPPQLEGTALDVFLGQMQKFPYFQELWSPKVEEIVLANFEVREDGTIRPRLRCENHMKILRALYEQKPFELYDKIACPVLLVVPTRAPRNPAESEWMKRRRQGVQAAEERLPRLTVEWLADTIHDAPLQRPREVAAAIRRFVLAQAK